jgi:hypothetical protein
LFVFLFARGFAHDHHIDTRLHRVGLGAGTKDGLLAGLAQAASGAITDGLMQLAPIGLADL